MGRREITETGQRQRHVKRDAEQFADRGEDADHPEGGIGQAVSPDPVTRADDQRDHGGLNPQEDRLKRRGREIEREIKPRQQEHQHEPRQHEPEPGQHPAPAPSRQHAEVDAQLMRFRARQHLIDREQPFEVPRGNPLFLHDEFLPDHLDLCDRSAPGERAKTQKPQEQLSIRFGRRSDLNTIGQFGGCGGWRHATSGESGQACESIGPRRSTFWRWASLPAQRGENSRGRDAERPRLGLRSLCKISLALASESLLLLVFCHAPVAQLDRASDYGSEGLGFDSLRVHHFHR